MNPTHSEYCHCECPEGNSFEKLQETLNRVRMLHVSQIVDEMAFCHACRNHSDLDGYYWQEWPCDTMRELENK
jgi:hypothetical protein